MLEGSFDFNKTPLAPPGTKIIIHEKPQQRKSWDPHGVVGWYLGPAMDHYRCYQVFTTPTKVEHIGDTEEFIPQNTQVHTMTSTDLAIQAANDLVEALQQPSAGTTFEKVGER
jgi:hypothetical protein